MKISSLIFLWTVTLVGAGCSKFQTKDTTSPSPESNSDSYTPTENGVILNWYGPEHAEDFEKFGGIKGYHIHWSTSPVEATALGTCGNILDEHGRPEDKYTSRIEVLGTNPGCKANVYRENAVGQPQYGKLLMAHKCSYEVTGLPKEVPLYFAISPFMGNAGEISNQWWGCALKKFVVNLPATRL